MALVVLIVTVFATAAALLLVHFKVSLSYWKRKGVPQYPSSIPFGSLGNIFNKDFRQPLGVQLQRFYQYFKGLNAIHGGVYFFSTPIYVPIDPDLIKRILQTDFPHFNSRGLYVNVKDQPIHENIFQIGGDRWKRLRAKFTSTFSSGKLKNLFPVIVECGNKLVEHMDAIAEGPLKEMDVLDCSSKFTIDVIGNCIFGVQCDAFKGDAPLLKHGLAFFNPTPKRRLMRLLTLVAPELSRKFGVLSIDKDTEEFFTDTIKQNVKFREENQIVRRDFFQLLLELKNHQDEFNRISVQDMANQSFAFFIAGFDTSSRSITYTVMELAHNQEVQDKVRDEIRQTIAKHGGKITYESIMEMKYLQQVLDETLRKYPPLTVLNRECTSTYHVPGTETVLDPGTMVYVPIYAMQRDAEYFEDPERYDPDRFSAENKANIKPYTYLPFGEGPRVCIGLRFGNLQTKIGLVHLLNRYRFTPNAKFTLPLQLGKGLLFLSHVGKILVNCERI